MQHAYLQKQAIFKENVSEYLKEKYCKIESLVLQYFDIIYEVVPLLQDDYGLKGDCAITSMTAVLEYLCHQPIQKIYNVVEANAKKYGYNGKFGTIPTFINNICKKSAKEFDLSNIYWKSKYFKEIGFNFNFIKKQIIQDHPLILSISSDGRDYYKNHSVTVVGYAQYVINDKLQRFLLIYDNWHKEVCYLDYELLSHFCSLNYYRY